MEVTQKVLEDIKIKGITIFKEEGVLALLCDNEKQCFDFIKILVNNNFSLYVGYTGKEIPIIELKFIESNLIKPVPLTNDNFIKYSDNGTLKLITVGFTNPDGQVSSSTVEFDYGSHYNYNDLN